MYADEALTKAVMKADMTKVTISEFKEHLDAHLQSLDEGETEIVVTRNGNDPVVLISSREWESMKETLFLLSDPVNRAYILESIAQAERGEYEERELLRS